MKFKHIFFLVLIILISMSALSGCVRQEEESIQDTTSQNESAETSNENSDTLSNENSDTLSDVTSDIVDEIEDESLAKFDDKNIILKLGLMSDLHFDAINTYTDNYKNNTAIVQTAVNFIKNKLGEDSMPAIVIGGDVINWNGLADLRMAKAAFEECLDPTKTELIPTVGNHDDWCTNNAEPVDDELSQKKVFVDYNLFDEVLGDYVYQNPISTISEDLLVQGYYHTSFNGVHILTIVGVDGNHGSYALNLMKKELDKIRESSDTGMPVFVVTHVPPRNTVIGTHVESGRWTSDTIANSLKDYPEVVLLTGHTHAKADTQEIFWQEDGFSVLHCGPLGSGDHFFATLEIDSKGCVRYSGYQVIADSQTKNGWDVKKLPGLRFAFEIN